MKATNVSVLAAAVILLGSCAVTIPEVTTGHVSWASRQWPGATTEELASGRSLYVLKCSGCHSLHAPDELSPQAWEKTVPEMMSRAKISKEEATLIVHYLVTVLQTKEHASGDIPHGKENINHE